HIFAINFDLAWCYYLTGAYEKAIPLFETLSGIRAPSEEIKQQSLFLLAECLARAAEELETKDPNRRQHIQRAIKLQTQFQADYPKSSFVPNSLYGRAYAFYLDAQMDKAEADLFTLIKTYATSTAARDGKYLLANVYSQQALDLLKQNKTSASKPLMDKARTLFSQLSNITGNLALANDSTFALADTWFQAGFYMEAISYFRAVRPKVDVLQDLHQQLTALEQKRAQEAGSGQSFALTSAEIDKIKAQMTIIGDTPDLMLSSYFRIALSFFELRRMDEMRIICRHLLPFMEGTQKEETGFLIINSFLEDHNPAAAAEALDDFQHTSGTARPIAEMASLAIGQQFMEQGDLAAALTQFTKSVIEYPAGPGLEDAFYMKFSAEYLLEQYAAAIQTARASQAAFPEGKYILNALYLQAMSQAALREWAAALSVIEDLLRRSPSEAFPSLDEATYQKGWFLYQQALSQEQASAAGAPSGKQAILLEAIKQFEFFLERYPDSRLHPIGMYQLALTLNAAQETGRAVDTLRQLAQSHPQHTIAPTALFQIAVIYYEQEDVPRMADALDLLVQEYPTAPIMPEAYFWLGWVTKQNNHFDEAT
ncbi:MAG: outer membrane protein assembly factor BamD, partial [Lentisphaerae bacterium]|nr:outer membrane protein assembly factor BamD [Lentisphaerota bacterium]